MLMFCLKWLKSSKQKEKIYFTNLLIMINIFVLLWMSFISCYIDSNDFNINKHYSKFNYSKQYRYWLFIHLKTFTFWDFSIGLSYQLLFPVAVFYAESINVEVGRKKVFFRRTQ